MPYGDGDLSRVSRNVKSMLNQGASEQEIDEYLGMEGSSPEAIKSFNMSGGAPEAEPEERDWTDRFLDSGTAALKERALGIAQMGMEALDMEDTDMYKGSLDLAEQYNQEQEDGGLAGFAGEILMDPLTYVPFGGVAKAGGKALSKVPGVDTVGDVLTKGAEVAQRVPGGKYASKMAPYAGRGAAYGAAYGGMEALTDEDDSRTGSAATGAAAGALLAPVVGKVAPDMIKGGVKGAGSLLRGIGARSPEELNIAAEKLKGVANDTFTKMRQYEAKYSKPKSANIVNSLRGKVGEGHAMNTETHKGTLRLIKKFEKELAGEENITLDKLYQWQKAFNDMAITKGKRKPEDAAAARRAKQYLENVFDNTVDIDLVGSGKKEAIKLLRQGKAEWAQFRKVQKLSDMVYKSEGNPAKLKKLAREMRLRGDDAGFSADEKAVIKELAERGLSDKALATLGTLGFGQSLAQNFLATAGVGGAVAAGVSPAVAGGIVATGTLAKALRNGLERGKAERLVKIIERGGKIPEKEVMTLPINIGKLLMDSGLVYKSAGKVYED
jgi:hypothetical protein